MELQIEEIEKLKAIGWEFLPTGPDGWEWIKFNGAGERIAQQGDKTWAHDIALAEWQAAPAV